MLVLTPDEYNKFSNFYIEGEDLLLNKTTEFVWKPCFQIIA